MTLGYVAQTKNPFVLYFVNLFGGRQGYPASLISCILYKLFDVIFFNLFIFSICWGFEEIDK